MVMKRTERGHLINLTLVLSGHQKLLRVRETEHVWSPYIHHDISGKNQ